MSQVEENDQDKKVNVHDLLFAVINKPNFPVGWEVDILKGGAERVEKMFTAEEKSQGGTFVRKMTSFMVTTKRECKFETWDTTEYFEAIKRVEEAKNKLLNHIVKCVKDSGAAERYKRERADQDACDEEYKAKRAKITQKHWFAPPTKSGPDPRNPDVINVLEYDLKNDNECPICKELARLSCMCAARDKVCKNGHHWHFHGTNPNSDWYKVHHKDGLEHYNCPHKTGPCHVSPW
jgi:hypothetical protein